MDSVRMSSYVLRLTTYLSSYQQHQITFFSPLSNVMLDNITIFIRFRTAINVLGDSIGAGIVYHLSKAELDTAAELREHNGGEARDREDTGSLAAVTPHQNGDKMRILGSNHNHAIC